MIELSGIGLSLSVIFSFLFPSIYETIINLVFRPEISSRIITSMDNGYYTGFTSEVSITAGIITLVIGYVYVQRTVKEEKYTLKDIVILSLMLIALLLTQKRSHLLFMMLTVIIVHMHYIKLQKDFIIKMLRRTLYLLGLSGLLVTVLKVMGLSEMVFKRFKITFDALKEGEDITSNRTLLYEHAFQLFKEYPLLGVGWENFEETLIGDVTVHTKMQVHNIYLQLLAETGIIGTVIILLPFILTLIYTLKISGKILLNAESFRTNSTDWRIAILYSLFIQIFFISYGLTGNPLYDNLYLFVYFVASSIIFSYKIYEKQIMMKSKSIT